MRFIPIASSSSGNAYLVEGGGGRRLLLECGIKLRPLRAAVGDLKGLDGCLITHEHQDHAKSWKELWERGVRLYTSLGTASALGMEEEQVTLLKEGQVEQVGSFDVLPFRTYHDCAEPLGFLIRCRETAEKLVFATDTANLRYSFPGCSILAIEANYDQCALWNGKAPDEVKKRIERSHMGIWQTVEFIRKQEQEKLREVWLLHLSDAHSNENFFAAQVRAVVKGEVVVRVAEK